MSEWNKTEGLILYFQPFGERDAIVELFSKEYGVIKLFIKGGTSPKKKMSSFLQPFSHVEVALFKKGTSAFYTPVDIHLISGFSGLKECYHKLQAASDLVRLLRKSQPEEKKASDLVHLSLYFLHLLEKTDHPSSILGIFSLKLLHHDGLLSLAPFCTECHTPLKEGYWFQGEGACKDHAHPQSLVLSPHEIETLSKHVTNRNSDWLKKNPLSPPLIEKVLALTFSIYL